MTTILLLLAGAWPTLTSFVMRWPAQATATICMLVGLYCTEPVHTTVNQTSWKIESTRREVLEGGVRSMFVSLQSFTERIPGAPTRLQAYRDLSMKKGPRDASKALASLEYRFVK